MTGRTGGLRVGLVSLVGAPSPALTAPYENVRLGTLARYLESAGVRVCLVEEGLDPQGRDAVCDAAASPLVVIDTLFRTIRDALALAEEVRRLNPESTVVLMGDAAESSGRAILASAASVDGIIIDDPEPVVVDLASRRAVCRDANVPGLLTRGSSYSPGRRLKGDDIPPAARPYLAAALEARPAVDVLGSRGCSSRCSFCMVGTSYRGLGARTGWRGRPPAAVAGEIREIASARGVRRFHLADDNALGPAAGVEQRALALAHWLGPLGVTFSLHCRVGDVRPDTFAALAGAGLRQVHLGIESGSQSVLRRLRKDQSPAEAAEALGVLRALGIRVVPSFIQFEQRQTLDELVESLMWMHETRTDDGFTSGGLVPLPGTTVMAELGAPNESGWKGTFTPLAFADPAVSYLRGCIMRFEEELDLTDSCVTRWVTAYHRFNDRLDAADLEDDDLVAWHTDFRRFEVERVLEAACEPATRGATTRADPVPQWLDGWQQRVARLPRLPPATHIGC